MATKKKTTTKKTAAKKSAAKTPAARKKTAAKKGAARKLPSPRKKSAAKKKALAPSAAPAAPAENPRAHALARKIGNLLSDKKALDIVLLDVRGMTSYADYFVVASGESDRQVSAMAEHVLTKLKETENLRPIGHEGMETGQWVLLDFGEVVAHLFFSEARAHYDLEGLWADARREKVA
ncbi:ribosome silencing factor [Vitiosangium sp. GDMCC 1.1324]|uniref:ribosome silencing factor n=1 Tax=Vitiosangium sp. (strain GDMCC 1.1324) TaxID=2138576 RepID=UPI000D398E02|nr:ribosome silencing factor [Vitiosangium sp. GDMCC 1.1324]PTL82095.1 ribosome silencing factor [Vitiosangium sp. GDMCC 1.1324]